jgi:hypothetical protein
MRNLNNWFTSKFTALQQLLILGGLFRLISVIFSKGFGWHDDHFLIIESSQSWVDGYFNYWLPTDDFPDRAPQGHALFYIGIHYYLLKFLEFTGFYDPQVKMYFIRFLHAAWSMLIIVYGYKISLQYASKKTAWYTGIFLSLLWFMPFMSVRNLVEFVAVPPLLIAIYKLSKKNITVVDFINAGLWLGIAFSIRFQTLFITAGIGLALILNKTTINHLLKFSIAFLIPVFLTQGVVDLIIWKKPFTEFMAYVDYNLQNAQTYGTDNWHMYLDLIFGLLIPPLSLILFAGYFYSYKKVPLLFWPIMIYLLFHTWFPNKQERFIMTVLPLMIVSGTIGMFMLSEKHQHRVNSRALKISKYFVISLNLLLLGIFTPSYSKRHRVETMSYLYNTSDASGFIIEDSNKENDFLLPPLYYYGKWMSITGITKQYNADSALKYYNNLPELEKPNYMVFWQAENIEARVDSTRKRFPGLILQAIIEPSFIDKTLFWLNPLNDNQTAYIYRINTR